MNNNDEIYLNNVVMEEEKMEEEFEIQPSIQTKKYINANKGKKKLRITCKICIFKEKSGDMIIEIHYVGHFIV